MADDRSEGEPETKAAGTSGPVKANVRNIDFISVEADGWTVDLKSVRPNGYSFDTDNGPVDIYPVTQLMDTSEIVADPLKAFELLERMDKKAREQAGKAGTQGPAADTSGGEADNQFDPQTKSRNRMLKTLCEEEEQLKEVNGEYWLINKLSDFLLFLDNNGEYASVTTDFIITYLKDNKGKTFNKSQILQAKRRKNKSNKKPTDDIQ
jgi:hypothetical protein